jgi:hypothetical protein
LASRIVLFLLLIELLLNLTVGAVQSRALVGVIFYPWHVLLLVLSIPALVHALVLARSRESRWLVVATASAALGVVLAVQQLYLSEALYGIDGTGGPYGQP